MDMIHDMWYDNVLSKISNLLYLTITRDDTVWCTYEKKGEVEKKGRK